MTTRSSIFSRVAFVALWLFVLSMPFEKTFEIPGLGTISRATGLLAMATGLLCIALEGRVRIPTATHALMFAFVLWTGLTYRWSLAPEASVERFMTNAQLLAIPLLIWQLCPTEKRCLALMDAYVIGTAFPAVQTLARYLSGTETYYNRYATEGFDPNDLALTLALSLPMSYYASLRRDSKWRWAYGIQMLAVCGTIFLTASRGGIITMTLGLSLIVWTLPLLPRKARSAVLLAATTTAIAAVFLVPATSWNRLLTLPAELSEGTLNNRSVIWREGWRAFQDTPLAGVGAGAYPVALIPAFGEPWKFVPVAHNSFLSVLVETGVIGMVLFGGMLLVMAVLAVQLAWLERSFWLTQLAVWGVGVSALTWEYRKPTWFLFGILVAHIAVCLREQAPAGHHPPAGLRTIVQQGAV